jgi:DNA invertase Pin-like site-specific DNA recombinase
MKAIGYVRVSTDRQAELGASLKAQEAKIRAMATVQGAELLEVMVDGRKRGLLTPLTWTLCVSGKAFRRGTPRGML